MKKWPLKYEKKNKPKHMQAYLVRLIGLFCWKKGNRVTVLESVHKRTGEKQKGSLMSIL